MFPTERMKADAESLGISLTGHQLHQFEQYCSLLLDWNQRMNLTAIKEPDAVAVRHFADSLTLLSCCEIGTGASLIDVGTGAGFPGVAVAIARPDLQLTLLDSLNKRLVFLSELTDQLHVQAETVHSRAEEAGRGKLREQFDVATARAVAPLNLLCEYCLPFVKVGGTFAAMKGPDIEEELEGARGAIELLGGKVEKICPFTLSDGSGRTVVLIKKKSQTPPKYPRHGAKITKSPL
ncbi:MAG: 16S rRNA (guanine(527)-N(7))-methyltransferase RsmG [Clostridiales bacterium]|nr:16S rRNA (guanine(527)-N(7))-methyltransferase RsmG [Clostridiales bacterium]